MAIGPGGPTAPPASAATGEQAPWHRQWEYGLECHTCSRPSSPRSCAISWSRASSARVRASLESSGGDGARARGRLEGVEVAGGPTEAAPSTASFRLAVGSAALLSSRLSCATAGGCTRGRDNHRVLWKPLSFLEETSGSYSCETRRWPDALALAAVGSSGGVGLTRQDPGALSLGGSSRSVGLRRIELQRGHP